MTMDMRAPALAALKRMPWPEADWAFQRAEPYRLLFPLGTLLAAIGMGIWIPYALWPSAIGYPGQGHAAIQIQGFLSCFIFGFLGTMLPKVLGVRPMGPYAYAAIPLCLAGMALSALAGAPALAQAFYLAALAAFLGFVLARFPKRRNPPPPPFLFIAAGMALNLAGTVAKLGALLGLFGGTAFRAGGLLQYQAFPLLLIVGVGGFLLPKLFSQGPLDPKTLAAQAPRLGGQAALCAALAASFGIEIAGLYAGGGGWLRAAYALRAAAFAWFVWKEVRLHRVPRGLQPYLGAARISLWIMAAGLAMPVALPRYLLAWEHVIFLSGFMRLTLSIAIRVLSAHAGRMEILGLHGRQVRVYGMLLVLAMLTRVATDIWPGSRALHLAIAAGIGLLALRIWARLFLPLARVAPGR